MVSAPSRMRLGGLQCLADARRLDVGQLPFCMGAPGQAGKLVNGRGISGGGSGGVELIGEHGSPFREPACRGTASGKTLAMPLNKGLAPIQFFGEDQDCHVLISPRLAGTCRPALLAGFHVFDWSFLRMGANRPSPASACS
jgi:hypothetical protein